MKNPEVIVIGGGLAGLTAAIHLAQKGKSVFLFEKEEYPRHKVCGEYVSKEILPYFQNLGISIEDEHPAEISRLLFSTTGGKSVESTLPLGGWGISRFALDNLLFRFAKKAGVQVKQEKIVKVKFSENSFQISSATNTYTSKQVLGAMGKRSVLDKTLQRPFFQKQAPWVAVKSHYENNSFPRDLVALHNFKGGYCGLSRTESGAINVCYLATYESFRKEKSPEAFKENTLIENPYLNRFFKESQPIFDQPLSIAQVSFERKAVVKDHILFIGDAAGLLHPLCGNGMAMAIHSAKIAAELIIKYPFGSLEHRGNLEAEYKKQWNLNFRKRIRTGKVLQKILLKPLLTNFSHEVIAKIPALLPEIIKRTHGKPFV